MPAGSYDEDKIYGPKRDEPWPFDDEDEVIRRDRDPLVPTIVLG